MAWCEGSPRALRPLTSRFLGAKMELQIKIFHHVAQLVIVGIFPELQSGRVGGEVQGEEEHGQLDCHFPLPHPLRADPGATEGDSFFRPWENPEAQETLQERLSHPSEEAVHRLLRRSVTHTPGTLSMWEAASCTGVGGVAVKGQQRGCSQPRGLKEVAERSGPVLRGPLPGVSSPELPWASDAGGMAVGEVPAARHWTGFCLQCCGPGQSPLVEGTPKPQVTYLTPDGAFRVLHLLPPQALDAHVTGLTSAVAQAPGQHGGCTGHRWGQGWRGRWRDRVAELGEGLGQCLRRAPGTIRGAGAGLRVMEGQRWWRRGAEWGWGDVVGDGGVGQGAALLTAADALTSTAPLIGHKASLVIVEAHLPGQSKVRESGLAWGTGWASLGMRQASLVG